MLFTSPVFLFLFLPIVLCMHFVITPKLQNTWLLLVSLYFYFWDETSYTIIMIISVLINYLTALGLVYLRKKMDDTRVRRLLAMSIFINLILFLFFKYTSFLMEIVNMITFQSSKFNTKAYSVHLPLGISFFTFHGLSYIIDVYRNGVQAERNLVTLGLYFSFFPHLIAGPIVRYRDVSQQLIENRQFNPKEFAKGVVQFTFGLSKKVLIANILGAISDSIFSLPPEKLHISQAWLGLLTYTLQIYLDFSGYSDMAIGLARMFSIRFLENFNHPYVSRSVREFWKRWHISLSNWFRDYLYISLGGDRVSKRRLYLNLITVFFLCGLWHGASWNFIMWGLYHGAFLILERTTLFAMVLHRIPRVFQHAYALSIISIGWVFFRAPTLKYSIVFIATLFGSSLHQDRIQIPINQYIDMKVVLVIIFAILGSSGFLSTVIRKIADVPNRLVNMYARILVAFLLSCLWIVTLFSLFLFSIMAISTGLYKPFIYFRF